MSAFLKSIYKPYFKSTSDTSVKFRKIGKFQKLAKNIRSFKFPNTKFSFIFLPSFLLQNKGMHPVQ